MTEEQKKEVAVFRFSVISDLIGYTELSWGEQKRLIAEKTSKKWSIPCSSKSRLTRTTILRWLRLYKNSNNKLESLFPQNRQDEGKTRALKKETCLQLIQLRKEKPKSTIPLILKEMEKRNLVLPEENINVTTVYRLFHREGLMYAENIEKNTDRRKFEAENPNDIWQSDAMHGPIVNTGSKNKKVFLLAFIDDHSRLIIHAEFYQNENLSCYLDALEQAIKRRGIPKKLYIDNGPAFRSKQLEYICASLGVALIHSRPYIPQGRGKIERWFRTVQQQFLPCFKGQTLSELNLALHLWVENEYNKRVHSSTLQTPIEKFTKNIECIRPVPNNLLDHFRKISRRRVYNDRTVSLNGKLFEAPISLIGKNVELLYHENQQDHIEIRYKKQTYGILVPLNLHVNVKIKRATNNKTIIDPNSNNDNRQNGLLWE